MPESKYDLSVIGNSVSGRPIFRNGDLDVFSERTITLRLPDNRWVTFPSINQYGRQMSEDEVMQHIMQNGPFDPITGEYLPIFNDQKSATEYAKKRSATRLPKGLLD